MRTPSTGRISESGIIPNEAVCVEASGLYFFSDMINVNDKLIREELPKIGVDAFAVLMCITSHINCQNKAWPGIDRLRSMTGLSKERTYKAVKMLVDSGHIERKQKNHSGEFGHIIYRLTTQYLGVFMGVSSFDLPDSDVVPLAAFPEHGKPEHGKPEHGKAARISINEKEVINKDEVINEMEGAHAQFIVQTIALENIPPESIDSAGAAFDWMQVAKDMEAYAKGEGAAQWRFMCEAQGYKGEVLPIVSNWASKASKFQLMNWKSEFRKLQTWLKTESRAEYKTAQRSGTPSPATSAPAYVAPKKREIPI